MEEKLKKTYEVYSKYAKDYAEATFQNITQYQLIQFISHLPKDAKVLDIGCGSGKDTAYLTEEGYDVTGIDYSPEMIEEAKSRVPEGKFKVMDMRTLEFDNESFDGIWCLASFFHIPKEKALKVLKGFRDVLKAEGVMYIAVKEGEGEQMVEYPQTSNQPRFFAFYKQAEIEGLLEAAGFTILNSYTEDDDEDTWINVFCKK
jgi:ubiquinone/menaquinone biosynthesis C-methylase UbiE